MGGKGRDGGLYMSEWMDDRQWHKQSHNAVNNAAERMSRDACVGRMEEGGSDLMVTPDLIAVMTFEVPSAIRSRLSDRRVDAPERWVCQEESGDKINVNDRVEDRGTGELADIHHLDVCIVQPMQHTSIKARTPLDSSLSWFLLFMCSEQSEA